MSLPPHALLTLCVFFWAGNAIVGKIASGHIPAFTLSFWRWVLALIIILPFGFRSVCRQWTFYRNNWKYLLVIAFLSVTIYNTFQYWALNWTSAINVGIISASLPIMILLLTTVTGHEKPNAYQYGGALLAAVGVLYVISRADIEVLLGLGVNAGDGLILAAVLSWAVYSVLLRRLPEDIDQVGLLTMLILLGITGIIPFYAWDLMHGRTFVLDRTAVLVLGYVGIFPSVLAYVFWNRAVHAGGANLAGLFVNLTPVFVAVLAMIFLGERLAVFHLVGISLIFAGIYVATRLANRHVSRDS
jgi:drug/metabolite transporter (DMT)-like permease